MNENIEKAFKEHCYKELPFTEEQWDVCREYLESGHSFFKAGYEAAMKEKDKKLEVALRQLNCRYSHTTFGLDFHCNKCGFTKLES